MKLLLSISFLFVALNFSAKAQSELIKPYIEAWEVSDTSQTHQAEKTYSLLKKTRNKADYYQVINQMYIYLNENPYDRLWIRTVMFDIYGKIELGIWDRLKSPQGGSPLIDDFLKPQQKNCSKERDFRNR